MMESPEYSLPVSLTEIRASEERVRTMAVRTPLLRLNMEDVPAEIYLKLENLQPVGSYKIRGAANAVLKVVSDTGAKAVWTASSGNLARAVAWVARRLGVKCHVVVPEFATKMKLDAIAGLGAQITQVPSDHWFEILKTHHYPGMSGYFIHPVADLDIMAGHGTIGLELFEDLPEMDTVIIPYGGGGLTVGLSSALRALKPKISIYACEVETAAPLAAALKIGEPCAVEYKQSFVDGIGARGRPVLPEMWPRVKSLVNGSLVVPISAVATAIRLLIEHNHIVAEGAGAASLAAALGGGAGRRKIVAIVSGGNIDKSTLARILDYKL